MDTSDTTHISSILGVGDELPDLTLGDDRGGTVRLREIAEENTVILFFYPRDNGLRCKTQACSLRESWPLLRSEGIEVFGVNHADAESHAQFSRRNELPYPLLVDANLELARAFGFVRSWVPPGVSPIIRSTVIVDPGGRIRVVLANVKASTHFDLLRVNLRLPERTLEDSATPAEPSEDVDEDNTDERSAHENEPTSSASSG